MRSGKILNLVFSNVFFINQQKRIVNYVFLRDSRRIRQGKEVRAHIDILEIKQGMLLPLKKKTPTIDKETIKNG